MKFSELWLKEYLDPALVNLSTEQLTEQITLAGLEVDEILPVSGQFTGVVVGRILICNQHPNADKLRVTQVDIGGGAPLNIVCGAANCREGLMVACATVGAVLPEDFKIKEAKLRGELSQGMLCSYRELGIDIEQDGIIELPQDAPVGQTLIEYLKLNDSIIEIGVTPNRADCFSIIGVARDVMSIHQKMLTPKAVESVKVTHQEPSISISVEDKSACPRYLGRVIRNIDIQKQSPLWLQEKLRRGGIRAIDPIVDVTNYVLLELGQPMHAFDKQTINEKLIVRLAKKNESLLLLNETKIDLTPDVLVIADEQNALALAGIFGGKKSGVTKLTRDILLESAYFAPLAIVGRARRYGLHTEASQRYERGVDYQLQRRAIERATQLILEICGGEAEVIIEVYSEEHLPKAEVITLRREKLDALLGHFISDKDVTQILTNLGMLVSGESKTWQCRAPSWRFDIAIEEDLIEEVARIYGYSNIPNIPMQATLLMKSQDESLISLRRAKTLFLDNGYQEVITYSFVDPKLQSLLHPNQEALILPNPISTEMSAMRLSLWTGLLGALSYNKNRQQQRVRLFETGLCFTPDKTVELEVRQTLKIGGLITGKRYKEHWNMPNGSVDFYDLKGDIESLLELTKKSLEFRPQQTHSALHPGQSAGIYLDGKCVGYIGLIHPILEQKLNLTEKVALFECDWNEISSKKIPQYIEKSRFPANRRDVAIVVEERISAADIINLCKKIGGDHIVDINLFDVYRGKGVEPGYKSLAISLILQDNSRTLEEDDIARTVATCVDALQQRFRAFLRD